MRIASLVLLYLLACPALAGAGAEAGVDAEHDAGVLGIWASSKGSIVEITRAGEELKGEVIGMKKPRLDRKNPDPQLRERPVIGLGILSDYRFDGGVWRGRLYDPGSGRTFASYLKRDAQGNLRLRGYVGFSMFGKTEIFEPVSTCSERVVSMLRQAEIEHLC